MINKLRYILVFLLFICAEKDASANVIEFRDISFEKGLPFNKSCFTISQDKKGFIWFGSESGLHRYDGNDFKTFVHDKDDINSIPEGKVYATYFDKQDNFWVATATGVCLYIEDENRFVNVPMVYEPIGVFKEPVLGLFENSNNDLFLHCHFSIYRYNPEKIQFERLITNFKDIDQASFVFESIVEKDGYFICGTSAKGVVVFNIEKNDIKWYGSEIVSASRVSKVYRGKNGFYWLASDQSVSLIRNIDDFINGQKSCVNILPQTNGVLFNGIAEDQQGNIWVSSDGEGIFKINPITQEVANYKHSENDRKSLLSNKTALIYVDRQNNLWTFFNSYGFNVANLNYKPFFKNYTSSNKHGNCLSGDIVTSFAQDKNGNIWIGTDGEGLNCFDPKNDIFKHFFSNQVSKKALSSNVVLSLYIDSFDKLWIGTFQGGLTRYDPVDNTFKTYLSKDYDSKLSGNDITSIVEDNDGNLYALSNSNGLNILDLKTGIIKVINNDINDIKKLSHNGGTSLYKDHDGNIWIGTYYGLNRLDAKTKDIIKYFNSPNDSLSISSNIIDCIFEDTQHRIWVGTAKGLNLMVDPSGKFKRFTTKDGLIDNQINSIIEDDYGFLWLGTNKGLSRINLHTFEFKNFSDNYNLPGNVMVPRSVYKTKDGLLYFGGNRGFTMFNPIQRQYVQELPPIFFTDFKIFDQSIHPGEKINNKVILHKDISNTSSVTIQNIHKSVSFTFSSLDYAKIVKTDFYYMMQGFDDEWRKVVYPNRTINYTNLDAGNYTLKVKSVSKEEDNISAIVGMGVVILPPWWKTWWAYIIYMIFSFGVLQIIIIVALNRVKLRHNLLVEKNQKEREIEIGKIKDNFYTSITHEFRTPLTLVLGPLENINDRYINDTYLTDQIGIIKRSAIRLLLLINEILDFRKVEANSLKLAVQEADFSVFFNQIVNSFTNYAQIHQIKISVDIEDNIKLWFDKNKLDKVFYNLLSNAIKYTPDFGKIECFAKVIDQRYVLVQIKDSGIGIPENDIGNIFNKFYSATNTKGYVSTGLGLYLVKEIVELHKGSIKASNNVGSGACFEVQLKLGEEHFEPNLFVLGEAGTLVTESVEHASLFDVDTDKKETVQNIESDYSENKPIVLLVEDNEEVRSFVKSVIDDQYEVLEAINGKHGLEVAFEKIPDLIISDIMMPEMDGRSLCDTLKKDIRTSHIPVILLTALSDIENKIEGLQKGADSYISKPFHPKHLKVRIEKLLDLRSVLQEKYSQSLEGKDGGYFEYQPGKVDKPSSDEVFMERLVKIIEQNISDSNYQLDDLCNEIGMNYLQLYRKVKAVTNLSIKQFILTIKMRKATKMLELNKFTISEVAYDVGFSSPAYFSETFKKYFSLTPSEYIKKMS